MVTALLLLQKPWGKTAVLRKDKKGMFRTLEAFIAIFITLLFLIVFQPLQRQQQSLTEAPPSPLTGLSTSDDFRSCIIMKNYTCINQTIDKSLQDSYTFKTNVSESTTAIVSNLPDKRVYVSSMFIAGNATNATNLILKLYVWTK